MTHGMDIAGGTTCYVPVLAPIYFSIFPLPFQSCDLMSHGLSPDLSPDFHHMTALIVLPPIVPFHHCFLSIVLVPIVL